MTNEYSIEEYSSGMEAILGVLVAFVFVFLIVAIVMYVLQAIALSKIGKANGFKYWWFSWIPFLNVLVMPMLVEKEVHESIRGKFTLIFVVSFFAVIPLSVFFPLLVYLPAAITYYAFYIIATWYSKSAPAHLIIAVLTGGLSLPISLLMLSGKERI